MGNDILGVLAMGLLTAVTGTVIGHAIGEKKGYEAGIKDPSHDVHHYHEKISKNEYRDTDDDEYTLV